jgi:pimeloyl-ACP methyl ester carboxylesterase
MKTLTLMRYRAIALLALLLAACSTPYRPPRLVDAGTAYPGLIDLAAQSGTADVLLVHGICTHDASWAGLVVSQLMRSLTAATTSPAPARVGGGPQVQIVPSTVETPAGRLRFNALIWSPLTNGLKRQLCYDQSDKSALCTGEPPYPYTRARLNARFKDGLIDDCLSDALIYQGVARDDIQRHMRDAVLQVMAAGGTSPLVVISHSMGSKILFDTLLRMTQEAPGSRAALVATQAVDRMRFLVMAANQIPLLSLADQQLVPPAGLAPSVPDSLQLLLQKRLAAKGPAAGDRHLTLVAFTDPNDLLSYTLQPEKYAREGITVYNILVSNAPTYFGLLERPDYAHLDYLTNPDVGRLIACGQPTSGLCKRE